jgi:predicted Zn-dependent protease
MNEKIHGLIGQALQLLQNGSPVEAEKVLLEILNLDPNNVVYLNRERPLYTPCILYVSE